MAPWKRGLLALSFPTAVGAIVFLSAGDIHFPMVWAVLAAVTQWVLASAFLVDPGLLKERLRPGPGARRDFHRVLVLPFILAHLVLTGLDLGRYRWSDTIPFEVQIVGLVGYSAGLAVVLWAMVENPFFSSVVRVQKDRDQKVISTGPYQYVRHPGYAAMLCCYVFGGLALGSWIGAAPLLGAMLLFLRRTATEDQFLLRELEGYSEYSARVRYRLIPGVW